MNVSKKSIRRLFSQSFLKDWTVKFDGPDLEGRLLDGDGGTVAFFEASYGCLWVYAVANDGGCGPLWAYTRVAWARKPVWRRA